MVIPTHRRNDLLSRAVLSAYHQSRRPLEIIVVVDQPSPGTLDLLAKMREQVPILKWVEVQGFGPGLARNAGVSEAAGDWIAFLDDDDEWMESKIEEQLSLVRDDARATAVASRFQSDDGERRSEQPRRLPFRAEDVGDYLFPLTLKPRGDTVILTSTLLVTKDALLKRPFGPRRIHEDWEWVLRAVKIDGVELKFAESALTVRHTHSSRESAGKGKPIQESLDFLNQNKFLLSPEAIRGFLSRHVLARQIATEGFFRSFPLLRSLWTSGEADVRTFLIVFLILAVPRRAKDALYAVSSGFRRWRLPKSRVR